MKTVILVFSLMAAVLFAAINNNSSSNNSYKKPEVSVERNLPGNFNENDNSYTAYNPDENNTPNYVNASYNPDNTYLNENTDLISASVSSMDSNYTDETNYTDDTITLQTFENSLSDDGQFVTVNNDEIDPENISAGDDGTMDDDIYTNTIWVPNSHYVNEGWNPYTNGRWAMTEWGWTWVSNYRWGWATYHYGRWWYSPVYGWVWSPGRRYAPAWVFWSHNRDYDGWYPISPRIHHRRWNYAEGNHYFNHNRWVFVKHKDITDPIAVSTIMPYKNNKNILSTSTQTLTLQEKGKRIYNSGPDMKSKETVVNKKTETTTLTKGINTGIKNTEIKKAPVTKTDTKIKTADVKKKTEIKTVGVKKNTEIKSVEVKKNTGKNDNTADKNKTTKTGTKIELKNKNINNTGIDINKKIDNTSVTTKSNSNINKTETKIKPDIKTGNSNNSGIKTGNTDNSVIKNNSTNKSDVKTGNTNNSVIKNNNTNKSEIKTGNTSNTGIKTGNSGNTNVKSETKIERTSPKVEPAPKVSPAPKVNPVTKENPSKNNSNDKKSK